MDSPTIWDYIRGRAAPPTGYWVDELPTWLIPFVTIGGFVVALLFLPLLLIAVFAITNGL